MTKPVGADEIEGESVEWLASEAIGERIPKGMLSVVAGKPDQGKGLFATYLASAVSNAGGKVIYSAIEDAAGLMTKPRLQAAGANLKNIKIWRFQIPSMMEELMAYIEQYEAALVIMDPIAAHLSHGFNRSSDRIREVLNPLTEFIETTGTAVVGIDHVIKRPPKGADPLSLIAGSGSGIPAAARAAYIFGQDPADEESRYLCVAKLNLREKPQAIRFEIDVKEIDVKIRKTGEIIEKDTPFLIYDDEQEFDPARFFDTKNKGQVGRPPDKRAAACEWLTNYLWDAGGPVLSGKIQEDSKQYAMTLKTLRRAAKDMEIVKNPPGGGRNCTWDLPEKVKEVMRAMEAPNDEGLEPIESGQDPNEMHLSDEDLEKLLGQQPMAADELEAGDDLEDEVSDE